ncbi:MAG: hypothetical protein E7E70_28090, partial [Escherichia coli]|nr:hypothetical protein [Escherichia coli]
PSVLGLSFTKRETIEKYIEDTFVSKKKKEKTICTFRMIGSRYLNDLENVYIFICICRYRKEKKDLSLLDVEYRKGIVTLSRKFGIYKVINVETKEENISGYFPEEIMSSDDYEESTNDREKRLLKEANQKKANKKFKMKKVYKV